MERTMIGDLRQFVGKTVKIKGWLQTLRDQKKMQFLIIRDTSGSAQVIFEKKSDPQLADKISLLTTETALTITGKVIDNPIVKLGGLELQLETMQVDALAETPIPLDPFADTLPAVDYRMDWRYLDLRRPENLLLFQVQTTAEMAMREYWVKHNFIEIHTPKLMGSPSESGAELFELPYFATKAYLAQSPQFYKQMAVAAGFERVFEVGPVFRADPSFTSRHMTEFTGVDMEMGWINSCEDVMAFMERWLQYTYQRVANEHGRAIFARFGVEVIPPTIPFPRIPMAQAHQILKEKDYQVPAEKKGDLDPNGERLLGEYVKEHYNHDFVFLTEWPASVRPFYHMRLTEGSSLTTQF